MVVRFKKNPMIGISQSLVSSEHDLQKQCVAKLRAHNMLCMCTDLFNGLSFIRDLKSKAIYKQHMIAMGAEVGFPDLIIVHKGICTFVEFKFGKGKKSIQQEAVCNRLQKQGYEVLEWRTLDECSHWISEQLKKKDS